MNKGGSIASKIRFLFGSAYFAARRRFVDRSASEVITEYSEGWIRFRDLLAESVSLRDWLSIDGFDNREKFCTIDDQLTYARFDSSQYYRDALLMSLQEHFPEATSITEYGCGVGRNLLFLKDRSPLVRCCGYELVTEGVEVAREAAAKFGASVEYAQLDYLRDPPEKYVFPKSDVAFTMFSLEQLPVECDRALANILAHTRMGTIHVEPVVEHYPYSLRGLIGRLDHRKVGYLRGFPAAVRSQKLAQVIRTRLRSSHNPLMFPSVYVLKKRD